MAKTNLRLVTADAETNPRSTPTRKTNAEYRQREYLTPSEMDSLLEAARKMRHGHRDSTMLLIAYRHGFRASEICDLRWSQVDFDQARLHVRRVKRGTPSTHPLQGDELRALRRLKRESPANSDFVFMSERGSPLSPAGFARLVERAGNEAGIARCHPHQLRHACGYALANAGHDARSLQGWLGHRNIQHTVRYSELSATRFSNFWK